MWQENIVRLIFGTRDRRTQLRTFQRVFILLPTGIEYNADDVEGYAITETICENGKVALLDLSGNATLNELRLAVEKTTEEWLRSRSDGILRELVG